MNQSDKRYIINDNLLKIADREIKFESQIKEAIQISDMLILLILNDKGIAANQNVFGVSLGQKKVIWQVAKVNPDSDADNCPFIGIKLHDNQLYLNNWCDKYLIIDPLTGETLEEGKVK